MRPHIFLISREYPPIRGGIATYVKALANELLLQGYPVTVVTGPLPSPAEEPPVAFEVLRLRQPNPTGRLSWIRAALEFFVVLRKISRTAGVSHLVLFDSLSHLWASLYSLLFPLRFATVICGSEVKTYASRSFTRFLGRRLLERSTSIICISKFTRDVLDSCFPKLHPEKVYVAYVPVSAPAIMEGMASQKSARQKLHLPDSALVLVHVARLTPRKGHLSAIEALSRLPSTVQEDIFYLIVGAGPAHGAIQSAIERHRLSQALIFSDVSDDRLELFYDASDALLLPSEERTKGVEGFGIVIVEAARRSRPTLATRHGAIPEVVEDRVTGFLFDSLDSPDFTSSIVELHARRSLLVEAGQRALKRATTSLAPSLLAKQFLKSIFAEQQRAAPSRPLTERDGKQNGAHLKVQSND